MDGNAAMVGNTLGTRVETAYVVEGSDVKVKQAEGTWLLLSIEADGSLGGPFGMRLVKAGAGPTKAAAKAPGRYRQGSPARGCASRPIR